jgi:hypothetical protein
MGQGLDCTCLQGLELALKWANRRSDPDLVRCTSSVVHNCLHRDDCVNRSECDICLLQVDDWLARVADEEADKRVNEPRPRAAARIPT